MHASLSYPVTEECFDKKHVYTADKPAICLTCRNDALVKHKYSALAKVREAYIKALAEFSTHS